MIKKISLVGLLAFVALFASNASAATADELQAQITALLAQIAQLQGAPAASTGCYAFTRDLTDGVSGADVTALQNYLASKGMFSVTATGYFGPITKAAVSAWQTANGVMPTAGYFGAISRAKYNATCTPVSGTPGTGDDTTGGDTALEGGAGSVDTYKLVSGLSNEKVGEDESDVEVAGLEITPDDGSDLAITAVRLVFEEGSGVTSNFDDYASDVSLWLDGTEVGRVDTSAFTEDNTANTWTKTISLDNGAIIKASEKGKLTVALSGISNLDSADNGDSWTVDFRQVRFEDADGSLISEDPAMATRTFTVEKFAAATNLELKASLKDDAINNAHVINVDATDDTTDVELLSFNLEAKGTSDILINELPVLFTVANATYVDWAVSDVALFADGEEIGSETLASSTANTQTVTFSDLNYTISAGDKIEFVVKATVPALDTLLDAGDTVAAQLTVANIDAEDESGEGLASGDLTGTANGEASAVYDTGISVELVSVAADRTFTADAATEDDQGTYKIVFDVTAFDDNMYIDASVGSVESGANVAGQGIVYGTTSSAGVPTLSSRIFTAQGSETLDQAGGEFWIEDGQTRRFTLTVVMTADTTPTDGSHEMYLESINWADATTAEAAGGVIDADFVNYYNFNLDEFKTGPLFLNAIA